MTAVDEIRSFNRFYTREIGLLNEHLPASRMSLAEARVLYELGQGGEQTAADLTRTLDMDKAHLSRILARFRTRDLVRSRVSPDHGKRRLLTLTPLGAATFRTLDGGTRTQIEGLLSPLDPNAQERLVTAMRDVRSLLEAPRCAPPTIRLRSLRPGDLGWVSHRQALLYQREYGWDWTYEGLAAEILGRFVKGYDSTAEDAWIADRDGVAVGSVFLMKGDAPTVAKLRLLYVEPSARGLGLGRVLVAACVGRARELGYATLTLWTNDVLVAARRIYESAGFRLVAENHHHSFGHDLIGQTWSLDLTRLSTD